MHTSDWLHTATQQLSDTGIATARLDCLVLLEDTTGQDRSWLLSHPEHELLGSDLEKLNTKVAQRANHTPLAYTRGHAEFYGRDFAVNPNTLVPRPETEAIIELLRGLAGSGDVPAGTRILDVGTGSGCIAITAALELPNARVSACDIDSKCLQSAQQNIAQLGARVMLVQSDLLESVEPQNTLLANLPYVPDNFQINTAATHEPRHALFGGVDGLDLYRTMFQQITPQHTSYVGWQPTYILAESLPPQHETLAGIAKAAGYRLASTDDFIQLFAIA